MSTIRRSTTGCWTCRTRRKKCDEKGLPCTTCKALQLTCYGYGSKPDWMDGADQEKAQMAAFKYTVRRNKRRNLGANPDNVAHQEQVRSVGARDNSLDFLMRNDDIGMDDPFLWPGLGYDFNDIVNLNIDLGDEQTGHAQDALLSSGSSQSSRTWDQAMNAIDDEVAVVQATDSIPPTPDVGPNVMLLSPQAASWNKALPNSAQAQVAVDGAQSGYSECYGGTPLVLKPRLWTPTEDYNVWAYYTETILPHMFPFAPLKVAQHECEHLLSKCQHSRPCMGQIARHVERSHALELRHFGLVDPTSFVLGNHSADNVKLDDRRDFSLGCVVHILLAEVHTGGSSWPEMVHYLSDQLTKRFPTPEPSDFWKYTLSYIDVLAATMTDKRPVFAMYFMDGAASTSKVCTGTGVDPWVLTCLVKICELRRWKTDQLSKGSLSMTQLMQSCLMLSKELKHRHPSCRQLQSLQDRARSAFARVFVSAAAVFLQCTVSEPRPEIVEIQLEVGQTITALQSLPVGSSLKRLAWPVCIAASMANEPDHQSFFRALHGRLEAAWGPEENICRALRAAIECWRLRKSTGTSRTYDWIDGMRSLGSFWLLF